MSNISTDFSTWSTTPASNQPDSGDAATIQSDLQRIQAALRIIMPNVNAALTPTHTELNYVDGVTSAIQTQLDSKATLAGGTFTGDITMSASSIIEAEGADVASATTTNIWATDGNTRHITGNTTITSFGTAPQAGARMRLIFDGTPLLTQGANLNLNAGSSNIQIEAGDYADVYADTTTQFDVVVTRKSGTGINTVNLSGNQQIDGNKLHTNNLGVNGSGLLGYFAGAGGSVTQLTSKATTITLDKATGVITTNNAALAANTTVTFQFNNSTIVLESSVIFTFRDGNGFKYNVWAFNLANGSCNVALRNITAGSLSEALPISFIVLNGATS
jgi:hypothetical protein